MCRMFYFSLLWPIFIVGQLYYKEKSYIFLIVKKSFCPNSQFCNIFKTSIKVVKSIFLVKKMLFFVSEILVKLLLRYEKEGFMMKL